VFGIDAHIFVRPKHILTNSIQAFLDYFI
jgi:hypothetical protein